MRVVTLVVLVIVVGAGHTGTIYKSVDKSGNVSYSPFPDENAVKVERVDPAPEPREEDIEYAKQLYRELDARDQQREYERRLWAKRQQKLEQKEADLALRRKVANQRTTNIIVVKQNSYYPRRHYGYRHHLKQGWNSNRKSKNIPGTGMGTTMSIPVH